MNIVLFGAAGQLGREWCRYLEGAENGLSFRAFDSQQADITDTKAIRSLLRKERPDLLVNCAAYSNVDRAETDRVLAERVNHEAVGEMAEICAGEGITLVHYSTDYIFAGRAGDKEMWPEGYPEDHTPEPVNWYGQTKWRGETAVRESGASHLLLRTSWLCGRFGTNFIKTMIRLSGERQRLDVIDDQWGSPSFAENVVDNTMKLVENGCEGTFHITSGGLTTWYRLAKQLFSMLGKDIELNPVTSEQFETEAKRPKFSKLSTRKLESVTGTEVRNWKEGLARLLNRLGDR